MYNYFLARKTLETESLSDKLGDELLCLFQSQQAAVDTEVVALTVSPLLASVVVVVGSTLLLVVADKLASSGTVDALTLAHCLDAVVDVGGDEDIDYVLVVTKHIVGGSAHEYAVALVGSLLDGIALELIESFL